VTKQRVVVAALLVLFLDVECDVLVPIAVVLSTAEMPSAPGVTVLATDEFWYRVSGIADFRPRLLRASTTLAWLAKESFGSRIQGEARGAFGDGDGRLNLDALATVGDAQPQPGLEDGLLDY